MMNIIQIIFIAVAFSFISCQAQKTTKIFSTEKFYQVKLHEKLKEISGIAFMDDGRLFAHQDEQGVIFEIQPTSGAIIKTFFVGPPIEGDFEDITIVNRTFYLLQSNGNIYSFLEGAANESVKFQLYKTGLSKDSNAEGLCFDPFTNSLLIALKGDPGNGLSKDFKTIYGVPLNTMILSEKPRFILNRTYLKTFSAVDKFSPSGIAINPLTGNFFIITATGNILVEIDAKGAEKNIYQLDKERHYQAEGIAFFNNNLYIVDEGEEQGTLTVYQLTFNGNAE